ncbi:MAG: hypothetical protein H6741_17415 [Alphaproteobacteria bacterium]|nr:hypothetical protein [Alphaproteobacteria bacterium]
MAPSLPRDRKAPMLPPASGGSPSALATPRRPSLATAGVGSESPTLSPSSKPPGISPLRIRIPGPEDSGPRDMNPAPLAYVDADPLGPDDEPSFPPGLRHDPFAEPPPPTEERVTDPGFATGDPPPLLSMPGSSLRSMLATPVEVAVDDDPPMPPPIMGTSPLLQRAAGANMGDNLLSRARAGRALPWEHQGPEHWREGRPSGPVSIDEDMRMGGRISTDGDGDSRRERPSLASEGRVGLASLHDINKQAKEAEGRRKRTLLLVLLLLSVVLLFTVYPGLLRGEAPRMEAP